MMKKTPIILLFSMLFLLTACAAPQRDSVQSSAPEQSIAPAPTPEPTAEPTPTPEPTAEPQNHVGDAVTLGDWEITLSGYEITEKVTTNQYLGFKADDGNKYVIVTLSVKNTGTEADTFLPSFSMGDGVRAKLLYQGEYEFSATNLLGHSDELHDKTLNPLSSAEGLIAFQIAAEAAVPEELELVLVQGKESVVYRLGDEAVASTAMASMEPSLLSDQESETIQSTEPMANSDQESESSQSAEPMASSAPESESPQSAALIPASSQNLEPFQDTEPTMPAAQEPEASESIVPPAPEPVIQPEPQTTDTGEALPANFTEWVPYSTSDLQLLLNNIAKGNVILYNGVYWASPTYANSISNEVIVYQNDIASDAPVSNRFNFSEFDTTGLFDESEGSGGLDGFN